MNYEIDVNLPIKARSYPLLIGRGMSRSPKLVELIKKTHPSQVFIITDEAVGAHHSPLLEKYLNDAGLQVTTLKFTPGELSKSRQTKEALEDQILARGASRDSLIVALGGGIVSDLAGFIAATYCRGLPLIMIPTSLLGMVDASIGGKNGINVPQGKNLIGTTYQPHAVIIDSEFLRTLSVSELRNGVVEMFKHGLIADPDYVKYLEKNVADMLSINLSVIEEAIYKSCLVKSKIVEEDETELAKRRLLNFGHTIGHAIEAATNHKIAHGRAVAIGILTEGFISWKLGLLSKEHFDYLRTFLDTYQIDLQLGAAISPGELYELMCMDKKAKKNKPRFVLLESIGKAAFCNGNYCQEIDDSLMKQGLDWLCKNFAHKG